jgi:hypothetical protein
MTKSNRRKIQKLEFLSCGYTISGSLAWIIPPFFINLLLTDSQSFIRDKEMVLMKSMSDVSARMAISFQTTAKR